MGLLQVQAARIRRDGGSSSQQLHNSGAEMLCLLPSGAGCGLWSGGRWQGFPWPGESCLGETGAGGGRGPSQSLCSREQEVVLHTTSTKAVASVAMTSWPQLTPPGVVLFLNIGSCCYSLLCSTNGHSAGCRESLWEGE